MLSLRNGKGWALAAAAAAFFASLALAATPRGRWIVDRCASIAAHRLGRGTPDFSGARERLAAKLSPGGIPDPSSTRIVVHKARRVAQVLADSEVVLEYPIALGGDPAGGKQGEGDGRTPEGMYRICTRLDRSSYHLFLGLSYPNASDADAGLERGAIDQGIRDEIAAADAAGSKPPWDTPLGGAVGLHGGGAPFDWTRGCVAFDDAAIEELWLLMQLGTAVEILP